MKKNIISLLICIMLSAAMIMPCMAAAEYDSTEVSQLRAFLEQEDADGIKNGAKISETYDADDPSTWGGVTFAENGKIEQIVWESKAVCGDFFINGFEELAVLNLNYNALLNLHVVDCPKLERLNCIENGLKLFEGAEIGTDTEYGVNLRLRGNDLSQISLPRSIRVNILDIAFNELETLDVSEQESLMSLEAHYNKLTSLKLGNHPDLRAIIVHGNQLEQLDIDDADMPILTDLLCGGNPLTELNTANLKTLTYLDCASTQIRLIDLSENKQLEFLNLSGNPISSLSLLDHNSLGVLLIRNSKITKIDLSGCPNLRRFDNTGAPMKQFAYFFKENQILIDLVAEGSGYANLEFKKDSVVFRANPVEGAMFDAWLDAQTYEILAGSDEYMVAADKPKEIKLIASYEVMPVTVSFIDGLTGEIFSTKTVIAGDVLEELPSAPEHEGYEFIGYDYNGTPITAPIDITAQYSENGALPTPTPTPEPNGYRVCVSWTSCGSVAVEMPEGSYTLENDGSYIVNAGTALKLMMNPEANHYVWYVSVNGEIMAVYPGNVLMIDDINEDKDIFVVFGAEKPETSVTTPSPVPANPPKTGTASMAALGMAMMLCGALAVLKTRE